MTMADMLKELRPQTPLTEIEIGTANIDIKMNFSFPFVYYNTHNRLQSILNLSGALLPLKTEHCRG